MRRDLFQPTDDGAARLLVLIDAFSRQGERARSLEGRTKLAKLDFLLRDPDKLERAMAHRAPRVEAPSDPDSDNIERRMVRYRYGPWDPAYFALLGSLIGRGLVVVVPEVRGLGYRTTPSGQQVAADLASTNSWDSVVDRARLLRRVIST